MDAFKLTILAVNVPGVLVRIALILVRYGYNIESIMATRSRIHEQQSKVIIKITGNPESFDLTIKQINKLVDVITVSVSP